MILASSLFALMSIFARLASRSASWSTIGAGRALVGGLVALGFAWRSGAPLRTRSRRLSWARTIFGTLAMLATFHVLGHADLAVGDAVTLFATAPLFIAALAPFVLKETTDSRLWVLLIVAFGGVTLVAGPHLALGALPALIALGSAVFSAFAMMFLRLMRSGTASEPESSEAIALHFAVFSLAVHAVIVPFGFRVPRPIDVLFLFLTGLSGGIAQLAMTWAYALTSASRLGAISYSGTVLSFVLAVVFLGERPEATQIAGAALVVGAGVALALSAARGRGAPRPEPLVDDGGSAPPPPPGKEPTEPAPS
jgi:drug/metabolite transporter (DMT)-like permease